MKLIAKIILSLLILFGVLKGMEKLYAFGLLNNKNIKINYVSSNVVDADVLIHGPCEPLWMIDPALLDVQTKYKSYNLALSHSDFADNYLHLYLYLKKNKAPKYMFLYVTPESMDKKFNTFNTYRFAAHIEDSVVANVVKENDPAYFKWSKFPFMKYAYYNSNITFDVVQGFKHYYNNKSLPYYPTGFEPPAKIVWDNHLEDMQHQYPKGYKFIIDPLRSKYLKKTIDLAKSKGITVILYESPVLKESLSSVVNRDEVIMEIKKIAENAGVTYKQFDDLPLSNSRDFFISSLNLNTKGIKIFNDTLSNYIISLP